MIAVAGLICAGAIAIVLRAINLTVNNSLISRISPDLSLSPQLQDFKFRGLRQSLSRFFRAQTLSSKRKSQIQSEMPDVIDFLWVATSSGMSLLGAIDLLVSRASGQVSSELARFLEALNLGGDFESELESFAKRLPVRQVEEFTHQITLAINRGSPLSQMLGEQAISARDELQNALLQRAGRNETRMLIPLVFLILPVTVLFAIYPSLQLLNLNYL
jgi:tight adherence protein C